VLTRVLAISAAIGWSLFILQNFVLQIFVPQIYEPEHVQLDTAAGCRRAGLFF